MKSVESSSNCQPSSYFSCHEQIQYSHSLVSDPRNTATMPNLSRTTLMDEIDYSIDNQNLEEDSSVNEKSSFMRKKMNRYTNPLLGSHLELNSSKRKMLKPGNQESKMGSSIRNLKTNVGDCDSSMHLSATMSKSISNLHHFNPLLQVIRPTHSLQEKQEAKKYDILQKQQQRSVTLIFTFFNGFCGLKASKSYPWNSLLMRI